VIIFFTLSAASTWRPTVSHVNYNRPLRGLFARAHFAVAPSLNPEPTATLRRPFVARRRWLRAKVKRIYLGGGAGSRATKPQKRCDPSQKGLFFECPQRHRATTSFPSGIENSLPNESVIVTGNWMSKGPFSRQRMMSFPVISVSAIGQIAGGRPTTTTLPHKEGGRRLSLSNETEVLADLREGGGGALQLILSMGSG
jgi:hypothetical protein